MSLLKVSQLAESRRQHSLVASIKTRMVVLLWFRDTRWRVNTCWWDAERHVLRQDLEKRVEQCLLIVFCNGLRADGWAAVAFNLGCVSNGEGVQRPTLRNVKHK